MKQFKSESKKMLELMINSVYTNREIFLRELISNASDALDKLRFKSLTDPTIKDDFKIVLRPDSVNRTLTISDNGIGMTAAELERNLGTIALSGTEQFKKDNDASELIGRFGVGFYSSFMAADEVTVESRAFGEDAAHVWNSRGADGYEIKNGTRQSCGTDVVLKLKPDDEDMSYSELLHGHKLRELIKKYSDYVRYPIYIENAGDVKPDEPINSMTPVWKLQKSEATDEVKNSFYKRAYFDYNDPRLTVSSHIEGAINYDALLFVPKNPPLDYYSDSFKAGLSLYSNGVMIDENCEALLPRYLGFVRGIVDSPDLTLNISRETLQHDRQLRAIKISVEKKILSELEKLMKNDRAAYNELFITYAKSIKFGAYDNYGADKDKLKDLLLFFSSTENKPVSLAEYVSRMKGDVIYYACGKDQESISRLPQLESLKESGTEVLYLTDSVDEFILKMIDKYDGKSFENISVSAKDDGTNDSADAVITFLKEQLKGKVSDVRYTDKLKSSPVFLTSKGEITLEMERVYSALGEGIKAEKVLEVNASHPMIEKLKSSLDAEDGKNLATVLYNEAAIAEGYAPEPDFLSAVNALLSK